MIHQYKQNGYNIVLDSLSGSVHAVDEVAYDVIGMYENTEKSEIVKNILEKYPFPRVLSIRLTISVALSKTI